MTSKTFTTGTVIDSPWLNDVNKVVYDPSVVNVKLYGALSTNTNAQNKTALQNAITAVNASGGGTIIVGYDLCYGVKTRTPSTWPDFTGVTKPILIQDFSRGFTQDPSVYPTSYDGMQYRLWSFTPQTTVPGQHDGNVQFMRGNWNPGFFTSNDANLAAVGDPSRTAVDNYRNGFSTGVNGSASWSFMQGTLIGAGYTKEELSNLQIVKFSMPGDTLGDYSPLVVERKTGNMSYGIGANTPAAHHFFGRVTGSPVLPMLMLNSDSATSEMTLRNSTGVTQDVQIENISGDMNLRIVAQGIAMKIASATRRVTFNKAVQFAKVNLTYSASITPNADAGNIMQIFANNGTAFTINAPSGVAAAGQPITIRVSNISGGALGAVTWAAGYKLAAWTNPANGFSRSITFFYDDSTPAWIEINRTPADVPN